MVSATNIPQHEIRRKKKITDSLKGYTVFKSSLVTAPSASTNFTLYSDVKDDKRYTNLTNSIDRITHEIIDKTNKGKIKNEKE